MDGNEGNEGNEEEGRSEAERFRVYGVVLMRLPVLIYASAGAPGLVRVRASASLPCVLCAVGSQGRVSSVVRIMKPGEYGLK
jgi:hypothetical protein